MKFISATTAVSAAAIVLASPFATAFAPTASSISSSSSSVLNLAVGEAAPDFTLLDQNGKSIKRSSIKKPLVVYFYPADSSPGCTKQAQSFERRVVDIRKQYGADVIGISSGDVESKQKFAVEEGLSFPILADVGDATRTDFQVPKAAFGLFPGRVTYVLDKSGVCQLVYQELAKAEEHVVKAEEKLAEMAAATPVKGGGGLRNIFQK
mmetsp:Transcript_4470/g.4802  ORF Transcript_4470/g.4802 Transcript_4470/m.4802 type:complete len:208 (+) Transcript_4470:49-672(+)